VPSEFLQHLDITNIEKIHSGMRKEMELSILFADIRSFTTLSERLNPEQTFNFINSYLELIAPVISEHGGFIDKYLGDGIMALFPGNSDHALNAAKIMQQK
jgi:two-component system sensor histidine kinase ChiS